MPYGTVLARSAPVAASAVRTTSEFGSTWNGVPAWASTSRPSARARSDTIASTSCVRSPGAGRKDTVQTALGALTLGRVPKSV